MAGTQDEAEWRAEFEKTGETLIRNALNRGRGLQPRAEAPIFAFRWLSEQERSQKAREEQTYKFVRWTFFAAVAGIAVGLDWLSGDAIALSALGAPRYY